jgi:hypothetical protein
MGRKAPRWLGTRAPELACGDQTVSLGANLLPVLASTDLYVMPGLLEVLDGDCRLILGHVGLVGSVTGFGEDNITEWVGNIRLAIARAQAVGGRVAIW